MQVCVHVTASIRYAFVACLSAKREMLLLLRLHRGISLEFCTSTCVHAVSSSHRDWLIWARDSDVAIIGRQSTLF